MPWRTGALRPALLIAVALLLVACGGAATGPEADGAMEPGGTGSPSEPATPDDGEERAVADRSETSELEGADDDGEVVHLTVVATVAPVADLVARVGGSRVAVDTLVPAGADGHTYEPRPSDVLTLAGADAYLGIGLDLNPGVLRLAREHLPSTSPLVLLGESALATADLILDHAHSHGDDDHGHGHSHGDDDHGHSHDDGEFGPNPHVWTSLANTRALVAGIAEALTDLDPGGGASYATNAEVLIGELDALDAEIRDAVATIPAGNRTLVTYHDAWTYFARDYGLVYATAVQPNDLSDPSASEVRAIIDLVRELDVVALFGSEEFPTPVLATIAEETGARYLDGLSDDALPGRPGDPEHRYVELMRRNAAIIVAGLGGDASPLG